MLVTSVKKIFVLIVEEDFLEDEEMLFEEPPDTNILNRI